MHNSTENLARIKIMTETELLKAVKTERLSGVKKCFENLSLYGLEIYFSHFKVTQ